MTEDSCPGHGIEKERPGGENSAKERSIFLQGQMGMALWSTAAVRENRRTKQKKCTTVCLPASPLESCVGEGV